MGGVNEVWSEKVYMALSLTKEKGVKGTAGVALLFTPDSNPNRHSICHKHDDAA